MLRFISEPRERRLAGATMLVLWPQAREDSEKLRGVGIQLGESRSQFASGTSEPMDEFFSNQ